MKTLLRILATFTLVVGLAFGQIPTRHCYFPAPYGAPDSHVTAVLNAGVVTCAVFTVGWNQIESNSVPGSDTYTTFDTNVGLYVAAFPSIKLGIIIAPASDISPNGFTPDYVMNDSGQYTCFCSQYQGTGHPSSSCDAGSANHTGVPAPFNSKMQAAWSAFIGRFIAHINAASYGPGGTNNIGHIAIGTQAGGESFPKCTTQQQTIPGVVPATIAGLETQFVNNAMIPYVAAAKAAIPNSNYIVFFNLACVGNTQFPSTTNNCDLGMKYGPIIAQAGLGMRMTLLRQADITNLAGQAPTSSVWVENFALFSVPGDLQEGGESSPTGGCASNTGSWTTLWPFAQAHWGRTTVHIHEGYSQDLRGTYEAGYQGGADTCWPNLGGVPYTPYDQVLRNTLVGTPAGQSGSH